MIESPIILNEREARRARSLVARIDEVLSVAAVSEPSRYSVPAEVWEMHARALSGSKRAASAMLEVYDLIRGGDFFDVASKWKSEPGVILIIARIARGFSQADLAERLGMREQQVQRYEAERYRSINLQSLRKIAAAVGVQVEASVNDKFGAFLSSMKVPSRLQLDSKQMNAITNHAQLHGYFAVSASEVTNRRTIEDYVNETDSQLGSPGLLRTGIKSIDMSDDAALAVWRARVLRVAEEEKKNLDGNFDQLDLTWLQELVKASAKPNGLVRAVEIARAHGIVVILEPQIQGLKLDGAALLLGQIPVVALTLRHDRIDNFWYTLLHEIGHIFLHYSSGLTSGFFDEDLDRSASDKLEEEADIFATSMLISPESWKQSTVRITRTPASVEQFAKKLGIHSAIVFGRIRRERNDYRLFSDFVGSGQVRNNFFK